MRHVSVQSALQFKSNLPTDVAVNTWHFGVPETGDIDDHLAAACQTVAGFLDDMQTYLCPVVKVDQEENVKGYLMSDPKPRPPRYVTATGFTGVGGSAAPEEVACCLSFKGEPAAGEVAARRRGRIFFGPAAAGIWGYNTTVNRVFVVQSFIDDLLQAAEDMYDRGLAAATGPVVHCVYSRRDQELIPVRTYWVDNAVDIQRRRGSAPTARTEVVVSAVP